MNVATVMVASVALGIVDDDTIHSSTATGARPRPVARPTNHRDRDGARRAGIADDGDHRAGYGVLLLSGKTDGMVRRPACP